MAGPGARLGQLARQFIPSSSPPDQFTHRHHIHSLSPTFFLARAASIEPDVCQDVSFHRLDSLLISPGNRGLPSHGFGKYNPPHLSRDSRQSGKLGLLHQE